MDFLKKFKCFAGNLVGKKCDRRGANGILSENEIDRLGVAGKYIRIASSAGKAGLTAPTLKKGLEDAVYIAYFILGTGFLLPWNAFISAVDYFGYLYPDSHVDRIFSVAYLIPCLLILALLIAYGQKLGARARINYGLGLFIVSITVVPVMEALFINGQQGSPWTYIVTVGAVAVAGIGDALVQGTLIGFAGHLPERYTQAIISGTGFSGVLVSFIRIVTKIAFPATPRGLRSSANIFFSASAVFLVICVMAYNAVHGVAMNMVRMDQKSKDKAAATVTVESGVQAEEENGIRASDDTAIDNRKVYDSPAAVIGDGLPSAVVVVVEEEKVVVTQRFGLLQVFVQVKWLAIAIAITYVITLAIFPGFLTEDVTSVGLGDWYPVLLIGCYNVFDLAGKSLPAKYVPSKQIYWFGWAAARLLFFPLFSACVHGPQILKTETPVFLLTALLGLSNGSLTTSFFLAAPKSFKGGSKDAETSGVVMVLALEVGLTLGSLLSWVWVV